MEVLLQNEDTIAAVATGMGGAGIGIIRISGSKAVLAQSAAAGVAKTTPAVLSFVREWCARQDSNLWPPD